LPAIGAPQVEVVGERQTEREQAVAVVSVSRRRRQESWHLVGGRAEVALNGREQRGPLGAGVLARDLHGRRRRLDVRIGAQRLLDQPIELGGLEHQPPLARDIEGLHDPLGFAAIDAARHECHRAIRQVGIGLRPLGRLEVRSEGASGQNHACRQKDQTPHRPMLSRAWRRDR
jgi:hypothetical protein